MCTHDNGSKSKCHHMLQSTTNYWCRNFQMNLLESSQNPIQYLKYSKTCNKRTLKMSSHERCSLFQVNFNGKEQIGS